MTNKLLTVIVPTLNEEQNIEKLIREIFEIDGNYKILVVDDGSSDSTLSIVKRLKVEFVNLDFIDRTNEKMKGLTISVLDGIKKIDTEYFVVIDGDFQHPPEKIKDFEKSLLDGFDLAVGYREKVCVKWPFHRKIITQIGLLIGKLRLQLTGKICKDILSGFFGAKTKFFLQQYEKKTGRFYLQGYKVLFDFLKNIDKQSKISDISFYFDVRKLGKSKLNSKHMYIYFKSLFK